MSDIDIELREQLEEIYLLLLKHKTLQISYNSKNGNIYIKKLENV